MNIAHSETQNVAYIYRGLVNPDDKGDFEIFVIFGIHA